MFGKSIDKESTNQLFYPENNASNLSFSIMITLLVEILMNFWRIVMIPLNTCFKNNKGKGKLLNDITRWVTIPRMMNLGVLTYFVFSFNGDVCFC